MAKIGIRVPEENKEILAEIARQTNQTISKLIRDMIADYILHASPSRITGLSIAPVTDTGPRFSSYPALHPRCG